jgi:hypothetical protein
MSLISTGSILLDSTFNFETEDFKSIVRTDWIKSYTGKKRLTIFPSPAGMSQTKLSLAGKIANLFYSLADLFHALRNYST